MASFLFRHGEKLALAITIVILGGSGVWATLLQGPDPSLADAARAEAALRRNPDNIYKKQHEAYAAVVAARQPAEEWSRLARAEPINSWAGNFRTQITLSRRPASAPRSRTVWIVPTPTLIEAVPGPTGVTIRLRMIAAQPDSPRRAAEVTGFELQRKKLSATEADWVVLDSIVPKQEKETFWSLLDTQIEPKTRYAYRLRVLARTKEPVPRDHNGRFSNIAEVRTRGDFAWKITSLWTFRDGPRVGITITKFDRSINREVYSTFMHAEGDRLGVDTIKKGHRAYYKNSKPRKRVVDANRVPILVDFDTGATLVKVEPSVKLVLRWNDCDPVLLPAGGWICAGPKIKERTVPAAHVLIVDDGGREQNWWKATRTWRLEKPTIADTLCAEHERR